MRNLAEDRSIIIKPADKGSCDDIIVGKLEDIHVLNINREN